MHSLSPGHPLELNRSAHALSPSASSQGVRLNKATRKRLAKGWKIARKTTDGVKAGVRNDLAWQLPEKFGFKYIY